MSKKQNPDKEKVQAELRAQQKFSVAGAIGRAGEGLMKGESPVSEQEQAIALVAQWIDANTQDPSGALKAILRRKVQDNELLVARLLKQPLSVLKEIIERLLASDYLLQEFVREIDVCWGRMYQERPLFQVDGQAADPADEYTHESVRQDLVLLLNKLKQ